MILGALIDAGCPVSTLKKELQKINLKGYTITTKRVLYNQISGTDVHITIEPPDFERTFSDISRLINTSKLQRDIKEKSIQIFSRLAQAEGRVHHIKPENVHFHEVGAVDSIIDIVGSVICMKYLDISKVFCSPLPLGKGFVSCSHGMLPVPAPATVALLRGVPVYTDERDQELVTPTGAAIMTSVADHFGTMPLMTIQKIGYGSGKTQSRYPNLLRVYLGELYIKKRKLAH